LLSLDQAQSYEMIEIPSRFPRHGYHYTQKRLRMSREIWILCGRFDEAKVLLRKIGPPGVRASLDASPESGTRSQNPVLTASLGNGCDFASHTRKPLYRQHHYGERKNYKNCKSSGVKWSWSIKSTFPFMGHGAHVLTILFSGFLRQRINIRGQNRAS